MHVVHPILEPGRVEFRGYQANLARLAEKENTLIVLPTGMGKTVVALLVIADALQAGAERILLLAPTRPLVDQHGKTLAENLAEPWRGRIRILTGETSPAKRRETYAPPGVVVATPQVIQNDLVSGGLDLASFSWIVFDEAHRGVGDYPYTFIGQELQRKAPTVRRLGLTASPGHDARKIDEVCVNLGLPRIEIRTPSDADVAPYVHEVDAVWETLPMPPTMARVSRLLHDAFADRIRQLRTLGFLRGAGSRPNRRELLELAGAIQTKLRETPNPDSSLFSAMTLQAQAMKIMHAVELAETQGPGAVVEYLETMRRDLADPKTSKASRAVVDDAKVNEAYHVARFDDSENPKMGRTETLVQQALETNPESRIIVFTHYRSTCELVATRLRKSSGVRPALFVGQARRGAQEGLSQKEQAAIIERFKSGEVNVLVATSVAEEGLDIPETDLVVFYEPIPSEIRVIQRRGRTGRKRAGRVVVLMTKGTQDEAAHWVSRRREQQMVRELTSLRGVIASSAAVASPTRPSQAKLPAPQAGGTAAASSPATTVQPTSPTTLAAGRRGDARLSAASDPQPRIFFDHREQAGGVVRHLHDFGAQLEARQLEVGDFILSDRIAVERKECKDFVDSLVDGRLFDQLRELKTYPRPFFVLEGEGILGHRNVSPEALHGALASISIDYGIPVMQTRDALETARFLHAVAKREQFRDQRKMAIRHAKPMQDVERLLFLLAGLPGVSDVLAQRLLTRFGNAQAVFAASATELAEVEGIGPQKASEIRRLLELSWPLPRRGTAD